MRRRYSLIGISLLSAGLGCGLGILLSKKLLKEAKPTSEKTSIISPIRFEVGFHIFNKWLKLKCEGKTLFPYFCDNEISTIAIYGMGALGERLFEELNETEVKVLYGIDRIANKKSVKGLKIIGLNEELVNVDAIIVTPVQDFYSIEEMLESRTAADIISLEDIIDYCS